MFSFCIRSRRNSLVWSIATPTMELGITISRIDPVEHSAQGSPRKKKLLIAMIWCLT